jgi:hypothetical protein
VKEPLTTGRRIEARAVSDPVALIHPDGMSP